MSVRVWPTLAAALHAAKRTSVAPLTWDPTGHLLARGTFGSTAYTRSWLARYGPDKWLAQQSRYGVTYSGYRGNAAVAAQGPLLHMSPYDVRQWLKAHGNEYGWDAMDQLTNVTLGLQAWSSAQLYEVLVDFFSNHLNVANHNGDVWNTRHAYDRDVIRAHAMGSFTDMLLASAKHPAMLTFLNLAESTKSAVNENYGRELLELHTVGLTYTENDVKNAAKLLTGRTLDDNQHYVYDDYIHGTGAVRVLGFTNANSSAVAGEHAGDLLLRYLAKHPSTATHLARKLCQRFVSDTPSSGLVAAIAHVYLTHDTQIVPTVSAIFRTTEFWQSRGMKVRRPAENLLAAVRTLGVAPSDLTKALPTLHWMTAQLGHSPLDWPAPNGYPDVAASWRSAGSLLDLWNGHLGFAGNWWSGFKKVDLTSLYGTTPTTSGQAIDLLTTRLTGTRWSAAHRGALQTFLGEPATQPMKNSRLQWLLYPLVALILDSPHHALR